MPLVRRILPWMAVALAIVACSSSSSPTSTVDAGSCGLTFFPPDYPSSCQASLDKGCCAQEKACAADSDCVALVKCINACPAPRQDSCVNACGGADGSTPPGYTQLNAIANCSPGGSGGGKGVTATDGGTDACDWPN